MAKKIRKFLTGDEPRNMRNIPYNIDMEKIYDEIDSGKTVKQICAEIGCSRNTLYRRHKKYQERIQEE